MSKPKPANPALSISDTDLASALVQIGAEVDHRGGRGISGLSLRWIT